MTVNFTKNQDEITRAWREIVDSTDSEKWALFGYEGNTNYIKFMSKGSSGLDGLVNELNCSLIQYAFCRVIDKETNTNKLVLINWQGDSSPLSRKGICASHVGDVANYFRGCTQTITIRNDDEASREYLMEQIVKKSTSRVELNRQLSNSTINNARSNEPTYRRTDASSEISADRKSFWKRQEEEEKERLVEEKKRAAEKQAQFERERKLREESEAKRLAEVIKERERLIEAQRQADKREPSSQPSSMASAEDDDDDGRVGRRSELIRLERNQETQSLISKGLIKNKRAIFEQAQQQQQNQQPTLTRRSSGAMIAQRVNAFKSLDGTTEPQRNGKSESPSVDKLTNGFANKVVVKGDDQATPEPIKEKVANVEVVNNRTVEEPVSKVERTPEKAQPPVVETLKASPKPKENSSKSDTSHDHNGNNDVQLDESTTPDLSMFSEEKYGIRALALYDYEASDNTEISFDPDDIIGFIQKVDVGWWHGSVITGQYKGQTGLFPSNYVEEL